MDVEKLYNNVKSIDVFKIAETVLAELSGFITELNRLQIEGKGLRSDGTKIAPPYAISTKKKKSKKSGIGGITGHITLFDKEGISSAFGTKVQNNVLSLTLDNINVNGFDLDQHLLSTYGNFMGLTDDSIDKLKEKFLPIFWNKFYEQVYK